MKKDKIKIGVVGFSDEKKYDKKDGVKAIKDAFNNIRDLFTDKEIHIVSGLTKVGIPNLAYEEAGARGWQTVGIAPKEAEQYDLFPVNEKIIVGDKFGDESLVFIDYIDVFVKIGGGKQSEKEAEMAKEQNIPIMNMDNYFAK